MKSEVWLREWGGLGKMESTPPSLKRVSAIQQVIVVQLKCSTKVRNLCSCIYCLIFKILVHTPNATVDQI